MSFLGFGKKKAPKRHHAPPEYAKVDESRGRQVIEISAEKARALGSKAGAVFLAIPQDPAARGRVKVAFKAGEWENLGK